MCKRENLVDQMLSPEVILPQILTCCGFNSERASKQELFGPENPTALTTEITEHVLQLEAKSRSFSSYEIIPCCSVWEA